jgi:tetratricopeptide (TPR) repeat protein
MFKLAFALLALNQAEPEPAAITDAWLASAGEGSADLWLALDGQPLAMTSSSRGGALELELAGFACEARQILPPAGRPLTRLHTARSGEGGCTLVLEGQWSGAHAFLGEGGILVSLEGVALAPAPLSPVAGAAAARAASDTGMAASDDAARAADAAPATRADAAAAPPTSLAAAGGVCEQSGSRLEDTPWDLNAMSAHGDCLAGADRTGDAITLYERVLAFEPGHYGAALGLARLRAAQGDTAAAAELFRVAADSARTDGEALAARRAAGDLD